MGFGLNLHTVPAGMCGMVYVDWGVFLSEQNNE